MRAGLHVATALKEILALDTGGLIIHLDLSRNFLGDSGTRIIGKAIRSSYSMVSLNLASNCIGEKPMAYFLSCLKRNCSITDVKLNTINGTNDNCITGPALDALSLLLSDNRIISIMDLEDTVLHDKGLKVILGRLGEVNKK